MVERTGRYQKKAANGKLIRIRIASTKRISMLHNLLVMEMFYEFESHRITFQNNFLYHLNGMNIERNYIENVEYYRP